MIFRKNSNEIFRFNENKNDKRGFQRSEFQYFRNKLQAKNGSGFRYVFLYKDKFAWNCIMRLFFYFRMLFCDKLISTLSQHALTHLTIERQSAIRKRSIQNRRAGHDSGKIKTGYALCMVLQAFLIASGTVIASAEETPMRTHDESSFKWVGGNSHLVSVAMQDIGRTASQLGLPRHLWCADAVNRWRYKAGLPIVPSRKAIDQVKLGKRVTQPVPGAIVVTGRYGGAHVDVVVAVLGKDMIRTVGGNVTGRVAMRDRAIRNAVYVIP